MPNRIRELRESIMMTQVKLSEELGVTQETISSYELARHYPSVQSLLKMSSVLAASMDYIMMLNDVRMPEKGNMLPDEETKLLALYRNLNNVKREKALAYLQGMLD
jgi:transcriptional regulator with XRE-family HTH domain